MVEPAGAVWPASRSTYAGSPTPPALRPIRLAAEEDTQPDGIRGEERARRPSPLVVTG